MIKKPKFKFNQIVAFYILAVLFVLVAAANISIGQYTIGVLLLCNACFCVCFAKLNKIIYWYRQYVGDMQVYIGVYKSEIEFLRKTRAELLREITELRNEKIQDNDE